MTSQECQDCQGLYSKETLSSLALLDEVRPIAAAIRELAAELRAVRGVLRDTQAEVIALVEVLSRE